jgi:hypothetical protein
MAGGCSCCGIILGTSMSITVTYRDGVFEAVEDVTNVHPGQTHTVFSDEELGKIRSTIGLNAAERASSSPARSRGRGVEARRRRVRQRRRRTPEELQKAWSTLRLRAIGHGRHWASNSRFLPCCREQPRKMNLHMHGTQPNGSRICQNCGRICRRGHKKGHTLIELADRVRLVKP